MVTNKNIIRYAPYSGSRLFVHNYGIKTTTIGKIGLTLPLCKFLYCKKLTKVGFDIDMDSIQEGGSSVLFSRTKAGLSVSTRQIVMCAKQPLFEMI